jgi:hypothetical protein
MGEANSKPTSFQIDVSLNDRYLLFRTLSPTQKCPSCNSGPVDTTEALKLIRYGKTWDLFELNVFENLNQQELVTLLASDTSKIALNISTDVLRFVVETMTSRSYTLNTFSPIVPFLNSLVEIAKENNIKLPGQADNVNSEKDISKDVTFSKKDLEGLALLMLSSQTCANKMQLQDGSVLVHGAPTDFPNTVEVFNVYSRLLTQLGILKFLIGEEPLNQEATKTYTVDVETVKYLKELVVRRSTSVNFPQAKLAGILNTLEEATK